jgi:F-type H+-transporting ATPase subunit epsilon
MSTLLLEIVTPEAKVYAKDVTMVSVKGTAGELGILPHHVPFVTPLEIAPVKVHLVGGGNEYIAVNGGFVEIRKDKVVILAETAELASDIDLDRAEQAKERAEERLKQSKSEFDHVRAELALQRALNRIDVVQKQL